MRAGPMRTLLQIQENVPVPDGEGGAADDWQDRGSPVWARVEPLSVREQLRAQQVLSEGSTRITTRWSEQVEQVRSTWRFVDVTPPFSRGTIYNVAGEPINKGMMNAEVEFVVSSGLNKG